ncbi:unnamed protein product, partial [Ixodes pacificus]
MVGARRFHRSGLRTSLVDRSGVRYGPGQAAWLRRSCPPPASLSAHLRVSRAKKPGILCTLVPQPSHFRSLFLFVISACPEGFYGANCAHACNCKPWEPCDHVTGACHCQLGKVGRRCEQRCKQGWFGQGCQLRCNCSAGVACHHESGNCVCPPGFKGERCDQECEQGTHGVNCQKRCQCRRGRCDRISGQCDCPAGFTGSLCDEACGEGEETAEHLILYCKGLYPVVAEEATNETNAQGFISFTRRLRISDCPEGYFGTGCIHKCSCVHGACAARDGSCSCNPGFVGDQCQHACPVGAYGPECRHRCECQNNATCDSATGICKCKPGFLGATCS